MLRSILCIAVLNVFAVQVSTAQTPLTPALPLFSLRAGSPSPFLPTDILGSNLAGQVGVAIPGGAGGLGLLAGDDVDAIAYVRNQQYPIFFSVDAKSAGVPGSAVAAEASGGVAAGDIFINVIPPDPSVTVVAVQEFQLGLSTPTPPPIDDLDALELIYSPFQPTSANLLYSLSAGSPTLGLLGASPADILTTAGGVPTIATRFSQSPGLLPGDDLDGLAVDAATAHVAFSLSPDSPSVLFGQYSAADILFRESLQPGPDGVVVALFAGFLDLLQTDNVDAIAYPKPGTPCPCSGPILEILERATPFVPSAVPDSGESMPVVFALAAAGVIGCHRITLRTRSK